MSDKPDPRPADELEIEAASVVLCPNCNGQRTVSRPPWVAGDVQEWNNTSLGPYSCPTCGAAGYVVSPALLALAKRLQQTLATEREEHALTMGALDQSTKALAEKVAFEERLTTTEREIRLALWAGHGHTGLYGDDGEMQCGACGPIRNPGGLWDYLREPLPALASQVANQAAELRAEVTRLTAGVKELEADVEKQRDEASAATMALAKAQNELSTLRSQQPAPVAWLGKIDQGMGHWHLEVADPRAENAFPVYLAPPQPAPDAERERLNMWADTEAYGYETQAESLGVMGEPQRNAARNLRLIARLLRAPAPRVGVEGVIDRLESGAKAGPNRYVTLIVQHILRECWPAAKGPPMDAATRKGGETL